MGYRDGITIAILRTVLLISKIILTFWNRTYLFSESDSDGLKVRHNKTILLDNYSTHITNNYLPSAVRPVFKAKAIALWATERHNNTNFFGLLFYFYKNSDLLSENEPSFKAGVTVMVHQDATKITILLNNSTHIKNNDPLSGIEPTFEAGAIAMGYQGDLTNTIRLDNSIPYKKLVSTSWNRTKVLSCTMLHSNRDATQYKSSLYWLRPYVRVEPLAWAESERWMWI